jgi:adenine-specific DNA methylase
MSRPRLLIEQWLPIAAIGAECMRENSTGQHPPLNRLHVWWARRPLTVSRAAILASLLPAYPVPDDPDVRAWPEKFRKRFPDFDSYQAWFIRLIGILGDPVAGRRLIEWANKQGIKLKSNPYGYPRAFTINPSEENLETLYDLLEWAWGTRDITFCDPMAGGGSIPFEALRYGLTVHANELNPVASVILKATLDYPARFGSALVADIRKYGQMWCDKVRKRLEPFYPLASPTENIFAYIWARTVPCPATGKPVPLSPNWWLRKGDEPMAVKVIADPKADRCRFEIVRGKTACAKANPDKGTIKRGTATNPWQNGETIEGDYIKARAQAGEMGQQLVAVGIKKEGDFLFRAPTLEDEEAYQRAEKEYKHRLPNWDAAGLLPTEPRREGRADWACEIYGLKTWAHSFSPRQLLAHITCLEELNHVKQEISDRRPFPIAEAVLVYLTLALDKSLDRNSHMSRWIPQRCVLANTFDRHDFAMKWSYGEFDASRNMLPWSVEQISDAYAGITQLVSALPSTLFGPGRSSPVERLQCSNGLAQGLTSLPQKPIQCITVDPPYYDNVNYAECSNYFYVWMKRALGGVFPRLFTGDLTNAEDEAIMNVARFQESGRKAKQLATADYENKMLACFREMHRILADDGLLTVMFTPKQVDAWDTLGSALIRAGFRIDASWPVHTEFDHSLHQAKKNAAASTILLVCRKREQAPKEVWWDDLKGKVRETARQKAEEFEKQGIKGVDLYISTFGPVLAIISENWPVLTSESDAKGNPLPLKPGEALDLARTEVINRRKQGLLLGRTVEFDPITDWYLMAWDAFRAQQFPADEARKLAIALGRDLEADIVRDKRLLTKKGANVTLCLPGERRKKNMVDPEAESFPHLIDALHTAMLVYEEDGSKACQVFVDRHGLRNDSRLKALVESAMQAIPTTRDKARNLLRPEMTTLEALRLLLWPDLPAPKEEEPPKAPERLLPGMEKVEAEDQADDEDTDDEEADE